MVRGDDIACHLGERLGDVAKRVRAAGKDVCIVVNDRHIVLGRIRGRALDGNPDDLVEDVMRPGPSTIRPDTDLETEFPAGYELVNGGVGWRRSVIIARRENLRRRTYGAEAAPAPEAT